MGVKKELKPEEKVQCLLLEHLHTRLQGAVVSSTPNEVFRSGHAARNEVVRKKRLGLMPGFPDLTVVWMGEVYFIEVKAKGGTLQETQKDCHARLLRAGYRVFMVRGEEQIEGVMEEIIADGKKRWPDGFRKIEGLKIDDDIPF